MEAAPDIALWRLLAGYSLLAIPVALALILRLKLLKDLLVSTGRMSAQLFLASILLVYLFDWNNSWLNLSWVFLMIMFACFSSLKNSGLLIKRYFAAIFLAYLAGAGGVLLFFILVIVNPVNFFSAQLLVVVGGMLLGNSMNSIVIGIRHYFDRLKREQKDYQFLISLGASQREALLPFFREAVMAALRPFIATMATMGIVFLPGMMTGQILGGASPVTAIKYQIAIMLAIFAAVSLSVSLALLFSTKRAFDAWGGFREN